MLFIPISELRSEVARLRKAYYHSRANECVHRSRYHLSMWRGAESVLAERMQREAKSANDGGPAFGEAKP